MSRTRSDYCVHCKINKHEMMCPFIKKEKEMMGPTLSLYLCMMPFFSPLNFTFSGLKLFWDETFMSSWQNVGLIFDYREQLMSSASEHWTRCDADTCPRLDTYPYPNGSSDYWSLQMTVHRTQHVFPIFEMTVHRWQFI